jgi:hypothetical protein
MAWAVVLVYSVKKARVRRLCFPEWLDIHHSQKDVPEHAQTNGVLSLNCQFHVWIYDFIGFKILAN